MNIHKLQHGIKKNYIKYIASNNVKYIDKIYNIITNENVLNQKKQINDKYNFISIKKGGGGINKNFINFVLQNIDLMTENLELFNKILLTIEIHDNLMIKINPNYNKFNYNQNILIYLEKIYNDEFIFV